MDVIKISFGYQKVHVRTSSSIKLIDMFSAITFKLVQRHPA